MLVSECDPLEQKGCSDGLSCFYEPNWTFCAPPETFPCEPGQFVGGGPDGVGCHAHCTHDGSDDMIQGAPECEAEEWCYRVEDLPEGVGLCGVPDEGI